MFLKHRTLRSPSSVLRQGPRVAPLLTCLALASILVPGSGVMPTAARAALRQVPSRTYVTSYGSVNAVVPTNKAIYIGGNFTSVGPRTGPGVGIDRSTAKSTGLPEVAGGGRVVRAVVPDGSGGFYVGGDFTHVGGLPRLNLAHILADSSVDPRFDPRPQHPDGYGAVYALQLSGQNLYVGGHFTAIGGRSRNMVAALDATTGEATSWKANALWNGSIADALVTALRVSGQNLYVGGRFTSIGGQPRNNIAALDATTGEVASWNPNAGGPQGGCIDPPPPTTTAVRSPSPPSRSPAPPSTLAATSRRSATSRASHIAAIDAATGEATSWDPSANNPVTSLRVSHQTVYAGGWFTSIGGQRRSGIAAIDATTGDATSWNPGAFPPASGAPSGHVDAVTVSGRTVYVGGDFSKVGGQHRDNLAAIDAVTGEATSWNPRVAGDAAGQVEAIGVGGRTVYAGGAFNSDRPHSDAPRPRRARSEDGRRHGLEPRR